MAEWIQWAVGLVAGGILGYLGRYYVERKARQAEARGELLDEIENWIQRVMRVTSIIADELTAINQGLPMPLRYGIDDRTEVAEALAENKPRVIGILESKALNTLRTRHLSSDLADLIDKLSNVVEAQYFQSYYALIDKLDRKQDASAEMNLVLKLTVEIRTLVADAHSKIADLRTRLT